MHPCRHLSSSSPGSLNRRGCWFTTVLRGRFMTLASFTIPWTSRTGGVLFKLFMQVRHFLNQRAILVILHDYRGAVFKARKGGFPDIVLLSNVSEPYATKYFSPQNGDIVIDIGAHVGKYSIPSAQLVGKDGVVFALEPIPQHFNWRS